MLATHIKNRATKFDQTLSYKAYSAARHLMPGSKSRNYLKALEYSCHGVPWLAIVSILCYIGASDYSRRLYVRLLIGLVFDIVYVAIAKAFFRRRRPTYANQEDQMIMIGYDKLSFPSGHASRAVYVALYFAGHWYSGMIGVWAAAVCVSRVLYGRHFIGDVLGGIVLGYFNYVTQFSLVYPVHAALEWFVLHLLVDTQTD